MSTPSVHCLGPIAREEFARVRAWLGEANLAEVEAVGEADLVVVALDHPDRFSSADVDELLAAAPLARWIVCGSTWCESIGRNRTAWPRGVVVPARIAVNRLAAELDVLAGGRSALPLTASRDEAWAFDHPAIDEPSARGRVSIDSPDRELARTWTELLIAGGFEVVAGDADVVLFDGDPWEARRARCDDYAGGAVVVARTMPAESPESFPVISKLAPAGVLLAAIRDAL